MPLLSRPYAHAWHSAGSFSVTSTTQHTLTLHDHIHTTGYPKYVGGGGQFVYTRTYFLELHDVQFVHHRNTLALFSPSTVDIMYKSCTAHHLTAYGSLRQFDLWSHCRSQQYHKRTLTDYHSYYHRVPLEATVLLSSTSCIIISKLFGIDNNYNKVIPIVRSTNSLG